MDGKTEMLREAIEKHCRLITMPVAVKLAKKGDTPMEKTGYPLEHVGHPLALCQGMTLARTFGWTMAFRPNMGLLAEPRLPDKYYELEETDG